MSIEMTMESTNSLACEVTKVMEPYVAAGHSCVFICDAVAVTALTVMTELLGDPVAARQHLLAVIAEVRTV